jgi:hypothetical protein
MLVHFLYRLFVCEMKRAARQEEATVGITQHSRQGPFYKFSDKFMWQIIFGHYTLNIGLGPKPLFSSAGVWLD